VSTVASGDFRDVLEDEGGGFGGIRPLRVAVGV
jgi:hypothetical protein